MEQLTVALLAPPDAGLTAWNLDAEHPFPEINDKPHTILFKLLRRWKCQAKIKLQKYTSTYVVPLINIQSNSGVQVPQLLNFDPRASTLISSDLGNLTELGQFFTPLRYLRVDSVAIVRQPQPIPFYVTRWELGSQRSRQAYFTMLGTRLGTFLAHLHGHRWQQRGQEEASHIEGETTDLEERIRRLHQNLMVARDSRQFPIDQLDVEEAIDKAIAVLRADISRINHPDE